MQLRNKQTGEIGYLRSLNWFETALIIMNKDGVQLAKYESISELIEDWEDYHEEPKEYWYLENNGEVVKTTYEGNLYEEKMQEVGNYFETKEEAEKAVEKLKAVKRLKDKGFRFKKWDYSNGMHIDFEFSKQAWASETEPDLNLLFGGEE